MPCSTLSYSSQQQNKAEGVRSKQVRFRRLTPAPQEYIRDSLGRGLRGGV